MVSCCCRCASLLCVSQAARSLPPEARYSRVSEHFRLVAVLIKSVLIKSVSRKYIRATMRGCYVYHTPAQLYFYESLRPFAGPFPAAGMMKKLR
jgi:hypothetical protein